MLLAGAIHGWHQLLIGDVEGANARLAPVIELTPLVMNIGAEGLHLAQLVAIHHVVTERWDDADALINSICQRARDNGWEATLAVASGTGAALAYRRGDLRRAFALGSGDLLDGASAPVSRGWALALLAQITASLGLVDETEAHAAKAIEHANRFSLPVLASWAGHALGHLALSRGDVDGALRHLERTDHDFASRALREPGLVAWHGDYIEALILAGHRRRAELAVDSLADVAESTGRMWAHGVVCRARAMLATPDERVRWYDAALAWHEQLGNPLERARTLLCRGRDARTDRSHDDTAGVDDLLDAASMFERLGATRWATVATDLLPNGLIRPRCASPTTRLAAVLSSAERRVADAVGRGLTNRQTAGELCVSPKTVDFHLRNIFRKLGVRTRTELALLVVANQAHA